MGNTPSSNHAEPHSPRSFHGAPSQLRLRPETLQIWKRCFSQLRAQAFNFPLEAPHGVLIVVPRRNGQAVMHTQMWRVGNGWLWVCCEGEDVDRCQMGTSGEEG